MLVGGELGNDLTVFGEGSVNRAVGNVMIFTHGNRKNTAVNDFVSLGVLLILGNRDIGFNRRFGIGGNQVQGIGAIGVISREGGVLQTDAQKHRRKEQKGHFET